MNNIDNKYWNELLLKIVKEVEEFNESKVGMVGNQIQLVGEDREIWFTFMKNIPDDFFSRPGYNTTENEPWKCVMAVKNKGFDWDINGIKDLVEKSYGVNMPSMETVVEDVREALKKID